MMHYLLNYLCNYFIFLKTFTDCKCEILLTLFTTV